MDQRLRICSLRAGSSPDEHGHDLPPCGNSSARLAGKGSPSASSPRWGRSTKATSRSCGWRARDLRIRRRFDLRQPAPVRAGRGPRPLSPAASRRTPPRSSGRARTSLYLPDAAVFYPPGFLDGGRGRPASRKAARAPRGPATFAESRPSSPSSSSRSRRTSPSSDERTSSRSPWSGGWSRDLDFPDPTRSRRDGPRAGRPRPLLAQRLSLAGRAAAGRRGSRRALFEARDRVAAGRARRRRSSSRRARRELEAAGLAVDYVEVVDRRTR